MPSARQCERARQITGSKASDIEINIQCNGINGADKFILSNSIEKLLRTHNVQIEDGWKMFKQEFQSIALEYLVDPAAAFCIYKDWKWEHRRHREE
jgi:hypothetical protein